MFHYSSSYNNFRCFLKLQNNKSKNGSKDKQKESKRMFKEKRQPNLCLLNTLIEIVQ